MDDIAISVIIPVYNVEAYIERCIQSVLQQTYRSFEIIAINDGSTDRSGAILDSLAAQHTQLRVFHIQNSGVSHARNLGISKALGTYIYFLDGDDWIAPDTFRILAGAADQHYDFIQAAHDTVDEAGIAKTKAQFSSQVLFGSEEALANYFLERISQSVWNKLFDARIVKSLSFDTSLCVGEDSKFIYAVCKHAQAIRLIPDVTYHYFSRSGSALHSRFSQKHLAPLPQFDLQAEDCRHNRKLFEMCIRRNVLYDYYLIRLILRSGDFAEERNMLRERILSHKWLMLSSRYCPMKYKAGILLLWWFPGIFMKIF